MRRVRASQQGIEEGGEGGGGREKNCIGVYNSNTKGQRIQRWRLQNHWQRKWGDFSAEGDVWVWSRSGVV